MVEAKWSGSWPALCSGEWHIKYNGLEVRIPKHRRKNQFNTRQTVSREDSDGNYSNIEYGMDVESWLLENGGWIKSSLERIGVRYSAEIGEEFYNAIQKQDFVLGTCGGCD